MNENRGGLDEPFSFHQKLPVLVPHTPLQGFNLISLPNGGRAKFLEEGIW